MTTSHPSRSRRQTGLTLIELLVALALGMLVVVIGIAALVMGQQGYRSVDATTQLRDRERFANDLIARVFVQAGYQDYGVTFPIFRTKAIEDGKLDPSLDPEPDLWGWNNAVYKVPGSLALSTDTQIANGNRPASCTVTDTSCRNGSDILVVRFQGVNSATDPTKADNTMINCMGQGEAAIGTDLNARAVSIFHVTRGTNGEPALSCTYYNHATGVWSTSAPMIEGVESFQLLFGTDGVGVGAPNTAADNTPDRWLRADQLTVAGNAVATRENWRRVRAVRVGLVLRGDVGSAPQASTATLTPLGSMYTDSANDTGASLNVAADVRLRLQSTFTVHLRNDQLE